MADKPTVSLTPSEGFALAPGEGRAIEAKASSDGATFSWTLKGKTVATKPAIEVHGKDEDIGTYSVTATVGSETSEPATIEVTLAAAEEPAVWHKPFAKRAALVLGVLVVFLSIPAYLVAWRAVFGKDNAAQVVAMFLVLPGLLALGTGAYLLLLDYRGRMVVRRPVRQVDGIGAEGFDPGEVFKAMAATIGTFSKATRGAAVLVLASVAIFGFAAWAAVGDDTADPSKAPSSGTSSSSDPSPSSTPAPASPAASPSR
jgi:hypothetical protein